MGTVWSRDDRLRCPGHAAIVGMHLHCTKQQYHILIVVARLCRVMNVKWLRNARVGHFHWLASPLARLLSSQLLFADTMTAARVSSFKQTH